MQKIISIELEKYKLVIDEEERKQKVKEIEEQEQEEKDRQTKFNEIYEKNIGSKVLKNYFDKLSKFIIL